MDLDEELNAVSNIIAKLVVRFPDIPRPHIEKVVTSEYEALSGRPLRLYISTLVEHGAKSRLFAETNAYSSTG